MLVSQVSAAEGPKAVEVLDVATVWAGHPVGFCLLTAGGRQFAAYYDAERRMTVAARRPGETKWQYKILPSRVAWDSHNYITMAADDDGHLHLSGNMHCVPLIYFRTTRPWADRTRPTGPRSLRPDVRQSPCR